ncbi:hypothetical protein THRCLA_03618 [Thraustotheca clavata]|uniref:MIT domain-containing protein n=1 Tax=Thraustotheca clavata TaxID=74557 RepID=A0A1W0A1G5_9STRA|nr:hypothetical protein THRCLA_03618 [Thraustotheca clavata]
MSLEDRLASLRAGTSPSIVSRPLARPLGDVSFTEVGEEDWDDEPCLPPAEEPREQELLEREWPKKSVCTEIAIQEGGLRPKERVIEAATNTLHQKQAAEKGLDHEEAGILYEKALKVATLGMENERKRNFEDAIEQYAEAGNIFIRIGRSELNGTVQKTMKKKAYSLLTRAEALAEWYDNIQRRSGPDDNKIIMNEALNEAQAQTNAEVEENKAQIYSMQREIQQLKYASEIRDAENSESIAQVVVASPSPAPEELDGMKLALVNEMHSLLNLPEVNQLRKFQPLQEDATKDAEAVQLSEQVDSLKKELAFEKATHLLGNYIRKRRYQANAAADDAEQKVLQAEVDRLRQELVVHQTMVREHRIPPTPPPPSRINPPPTVPEKKSFFNFKSNVISNAFYKGPRGLKKQVDHQADTQPTTTRRHSHSSLSIPPRSLDTKQHSISDTEEEHSIWL